MENKELISKIEGLTLGDHLCVIYKTETEHKNLMIPFIKQGLIKNQAILYITDARQTTDIIHYFSAENINIQRYIDNGQLMFASSKETYLKDETFDPDRMLQMLNEITQEIISKGFTALRISGEMSWFFKGQSDYAKLIEYEAKLNIFLHNYPAIGLCQYDQRRFNSEVLLDVIRTHPYVIIGNKVYDNFYYIPPTEFLSENKSDAILNNWISNLDKKNRDERELKEKSQSLQMLFDNADDRIIQMDLDLKPIMMNRSYYEKLGYTKEELIDHWEYNIIHPEDKPKLDNLKTELFQKETLSIEYRVKHKNGKWLSQSAKASIIKKEEIPQSILCIIRDTTSLQDAQLKLSQSQKLLSEAERIAHIGSWELDINTMGSTWSDEMYRICGYEPNAFKPTIEKSMQIIHPDDREKAEKLVIEAIERTGCYEIEKRIIRPDNVVRYIYSKAEMRYDENHKPSKLVGVFQDITNRIKIEKSLKESEELYRTVFQNSPSGICLTDTKGCFIYMNQAYLNIVGYSEKELIGKSFTQITHPDDIDGELHYLEQYLEAKPRFGRVEKRYIHKNGHIIWVALNTSFLYKDEFIQEDLAISIVEDITEKKQTEDLLAKYQKLYEAVVRQAPIAIQIVEGSPDDVKVVIENEESIRILDESIEGSDHINTNNHRFKSKFYTEDGKTEIPVSKLPTTKALKGEPIFDEIITIQHPDGKQIIVETNAYPIYQDNHIMAVAVMFYDITEQKQAERNLIESENRLKRIVLNMPVLLDAFDKNNNIIIWNKECERVTGYKPDEILKRSNAMEMLYPDKEYFNEMMNMFLSMGNNFRDLETKITCKDGSHKYIMWSNLSDEYPIEGWASWAVGIDVTNLRKTEENLKIALEKAKTADRLKSAFLANMSHEIRTPLNGILGFVDLMLDDTELNEHYKENLQFVKNSGKHLLYLINDILELSKIEAGEVSLNNKPIQLINEIQQNISNANMLIAKKEKDLSIEIEYPPDFLENILLDPTKFKQIMDNLLSNAVKFTASGTITIRLERNSPDYFQIHVKDTGSGISEDRLEAIFKPFEQENEEISIAYGGTGLGLSITKRLVELMGGEIRVKSTKQKGTTFTITLPFIKSNVKQIKEDKSSQKEKTKSNPLILIVEDNEISRNFMMRLMDNFQFRYLLAHDGSNAIEIYKSNPNIDLILMDIRMPKMNGIEATKEIRKLDQMQKRKNIPIIALTAAAMLEDVRVAKENGINDYITKPFDKKELIEVMEKYIKQPNINH